MLSTIAKLMQCSSIEVDDTIFCPPLMKQANKPMHNISPQPPGMLCATSLGSDFKILQTNGLLKLK
jgi:hypothetical protein